VMKLTTQNKTLVDSLKHVVESTYRHCAGRDWDDTERALVGEAGNVLSGVADIWYDCHARKWRTYEEDV
jgi:hypothetical protein